MPLPFQQQGQMGASVAGASAAHGRHAQLGEGLRSINRAARAACPRTHRSSSRQEGSSSSTAGWPTTTSSALARVTATLKRRGAPQKPRWASAGGEGGQEGRGRARQRTVSADKAAGLRLLKFYCSTEAQVGVYRRGERRGGWGTPGGVGVGWESDGGSCWRRWWRCHLAPQANACRHATNDHRTTPAMSRLGQTGARTASSRHGSGVRAPVAAAPAGCAGATDSGLLHAMEGGSTQRYHYWQGDGSKGGAQYASRATWRQRRCQGGGGGFHVRAGRAMLVLGSVSRPPERGADEDAALLLALVIVDCAALQRSRGGGQAPPMHQGTARRRAVMRCTAKAGQARRGSRPRKAGGALTVGLARKARSARPGAERALSRETPPLAGTTLPPPFPHPDSAQASLAQQQADLLNLRGRGS